MKLIEQILSDRNLTEACREVIRNRGASGIDSMGVKELEAYLRKNREKLKTIIRSGNYIPQPIRKKKSPSQMVRSVYWESPPWLTGCYSRQYPVLSALDMRTCF